MLRLGFIQTFLGVIGLVASAPAKSAPTAGRLIRIQSSPIAGFQYHNGEAVRKGLCIGQALTLVREPCNPYDNMAARVDWFGHKLGYVPRLENYAVAGLLDRGEKPSARIIALNDKSDARRWDGTGKGCDLKACWKREHAKGCANS